MALIVLWLPLLAVTRLFDRDPARYRTGRVFRKLGKWITRINPGWDITISGNKAIDDRNPYIVVCNHLSSADIPLISNLPWEMKWMAKKELFDTPVIGWMMKLAGDIPVDRRNPQRQLSTFKQSIHYLRNNCSVMFFPEGTRSRTGRVKRFNQGAFRMAVNENIPILPLVIDGTQNCLPKNSWKFGKAPEIRLRVLEPINTVGMNKGDVSQLTDAVRVAIMEQLAEWRNTDLKSVDGTAHRRRE